ncbi:MAG: SGNH/GDSL hydrolase family protein [Bryobacterales bacterium]|nr:SGNH/GDSL hydrolase family protein [Bryobacterales bacterium]
MKNSALRRRTVWIAIVLALCSWSWPDASHAQGGPDRWEGAIRAFEESDRANPPPEGGIVFLGSSSFRRWDLDKSFPGRGLINRGFGGSQMADALRYLDRIVLPLKPRILLLYEGDNDLASGKSPETVASEFHEMVARVHAALPATKIVFVGIKPSIRRWNLIGSIREANARVRTVTESSELLVYIDVDAPLLGDDGEPRPDLFVEDGLHLSAAGYAIWTELVAPHLE